MNIDAMNDLPSSNNTMHRMFFVNVIDNSCITKFLC